MRDNRKGIEGSKVLWTILVGVFGIFAFVTVTHGIGKYAQATQGALIEEQTERVAKAIDIMQSYDNSEILMKFNSKYDIEVGISSVENKGVDFGSMKKFVKMTSKGKSASSNPFVFYYKIKPKRSGRTKLKGVKNLCIAKRGKKLWLVNMNEPSPAPLEVKRSCRQE